MRWIIWGVGVWGRKFLKNIRDSKMDIQIVAFVDNNSDLWGTTINSLIVVSPEQLDSVVFDHIIICSLNFADEIRSQLIKMGISPDRIIRNGTDQSPVRFDAKAKDCFLAQLGEFGFEMISWLPYLSYLKAQGLKLKTLGRKGSRVFYEKISDEHIEVDDEYIGDMFGELELIEKLKRDTGLPIFAPCNERIDFGFYVNGIEWQVKDIHSFYPINHLKKPEFNPQGILGIRQMKENYRGLVTINNKNYYNWKFTLVKNFFTSEELDTLIKFLTEKGFLVVYNNPALLFYEKTNIYENPPSISFQSKALLNLSDFSDGSVDKWDRMQLECWQNSDFVIQVPSGAAAVSEILGVRKLYLMRKGDYQDNVYLEKLYKGKSDSFYEIEHMIMYLEREIS